MKIKFDENLDARLITLFLEGGHEAITIPSQGLRGVKDEVLYEICKNEDYILVSLDLDFSNCLNYPPAGTPGIVVLRGPDNFFPTMRILIETLIQALSIHSPAGRLWIVEPGRLRIHEDI